MKTFTYQYSQPSDYHFSLDSVELARQVAEQVNIQTVKSEDFSVLDLCAGCGVVGFDFHFYAPWVKQVDFMEVQKIYVEHFSHNLRKVLAGPHRPVTTQFNFILENYIVLKNESHHERYDLIMSNPPYFEVDQGRLSPNEFKNRCRFFIDSDFTTMCEGILNALKLNGWAYILIRPLQDHGKDLLAQLQVIALQRAKVQVINEIRGTLLVAVHKTA